MRIGDGEFVFVVYLGAGHIHRPKAVSLQEKRIGGVRPAIEGSDHAHGLGERRPDAESNPCVIWGRPHERPLGSGHELSSVARVSFFYSAIGTWGGVGNI